MFLRLASDWQKVRYAWSVRLILLAGLLSGLEIILPIIDQARIQPEGSIVVLADYNNTYSARMGDLRSPDSVGVRIGPKH